jgi:hypothetical protein
MEYTKKLLVRAGDAVKLCSQYVALELKTYNTLQAASKQKSLVNHLRVNTFASITSR